MEDADRIPIDLGYEVTAAASEADQQTTVRDDGTIVIDILAPQPCNPKPSSETEIVVCAQLPGESERPIAAPPPAPNVSETIREALTVKIGPVEISPGAGGAVGFTARIRF